MRALGRWVGLSFLVVAIAALPVDLRADGPAVGEPAFGVALGVAKGHLLAGRGAEGMKVVKAALEKHTNQDYVRAKRADLEDLVRRLAFCAECPAPDPQSVVKGTLKKFVSKSGEIDIRYSAGKPTDFEVLEDGVLLFPAPFRGAYTITVQGDSYPTTTESSPRIVVGGTEHPKTQKKQTWSVYFGVPPYDEGNKVRWLPAQIVYTDGDEKKVVFDKETSPATPKKPYRVEVAVTASRVTAKLNGMVLGTAQKSDGVFGYAIIDLPKWKEIVLTGLVEPSFIQAKLDAIVDAKRAAFEQSFDVRTLLPPWVYEAASPQAVPPPAEGDPTAGVPAEHAEEWVAGLERLAADDFEAALAVAESLRGKGAPAGLVGILAARARLGLDQATKALKEIDAAIAADPGSLDAMTTKVEILLRLGRETELAAALRALVAHPKAGVDDLEAAGLFSLLAGRIEDALGAVEGAARRGLRSPLLERLSKVIVRAKNGPDWPKTFEVKSANYHVLSDIDVETCRRAADLLEEALLAYRARVRPLKAAPKRLYKVFLFSGEAGFQRYHAEASLSKGRTLENAAGLYVPLLKQLLIWNLPSREEMMRTVRHEGFHQYLDRLLPDPPVWLNEGLAVYYEGMERVAGDLRTDLARPELLEDLGKTPLVPLKEFLRIQPKQFYETAPHSYAQAWLFVHMLQHGPTKHRDRFRALLTRLETDAGGEAVEAVFPDADLEALDRELAAYVATLPTHR